VTVLDVLLQVAQEPRAAPSKPTDLQKAFKQRPVAASSNAVTLKWVGATVAARALPRRAAPVRPGPETSCP
jgi:hypothetical protein